MRRPQFGLIVIVVDAGLVVAFLIAEGSDATALRAQVLAQELVAPSLLDIEVLSALRALHRGGKVSERRVRIAIDDLKMLPVGRHDHTSLLPRCWQLRDNLSVYDASYVALAELFGIEVWTTDRRMQRAPGARCSIRVL